MLYNHGGGGTTPPSAAVLGPPLAPPTHGMIVIGPAQDILDESYLVSIESRGYIQVRRVAVPLKKIAFD